MPGCSAPYCNSHSRKGFKFHRFPSDPERRKIWMINCRRTTDWNPKQSDRLCSKHFEEDQYEEHRQDGKKLLKPFAVPTLLFNVPKLPSENLTSTNEMIPNEKHFEESQYEEHWEDGKTLLKHFAAPTSLFNIPKLPSENFTSTNGMIPKEEIIDSENTSSEDESKSRCTEYTSLKKEENEKTKTI